MSQPLYDFTPRERLFELIKQEDVALTRARRDKDARPQHLTENELTTLKSIALRSFGRSATL